MQEADNVSSNQYLTFLLDGEVYGLSISTVREVLAFTSVTRVPQTPSYVRGVINLRGNVVPVIDLNTRFHGQQTEKSVDTCIIIVEIIIGSEAVLFGALADSVREVLELEHDQIAPPPKLGSRVNAAFIKGMGKKDDEFVILLDIDKLFSSEELITVQQAVF
ncbi:chemotaxis protein CheW [Desulfogranum japonicum]|uniref:chemotaxis protein CheW n=1 Tax=Desulfogranum japonicum TaxID=231447 RepID=UPI00041ABAF4|nr:chemotaxis protein CheW [Desulfogranum japonicum]